MYTNSIQVITIKVTTNEQEVEEIRTRLENEESLIEQFEKEMKKLKKQIRKENIKQVLTKFDVSLPHRRFLVL